MRFPMFLAAAVLAGAACLAAEDGGPPGPPPADRDRPFGFRPPVLPIQATLDANGDGTISADEIRAAAKSLEKLDKNKDGKLSAEEIGWPPGRMDFGRGGLPGGPFGGPFGGPQGCRGLAERILARDANRDGKLTPEELPRSMLPILMRADANKDGVLEAAEIERFSQQLVPAAAKPRD